MLVAVISLSTETVLTWALGACQGKHTGEQALFRQLFALMKAPPDDGDADGEDEADAGGEADVGDDDT